MALSWSNRAMRPVIGITPDEGTTVGRAGRPSVARYELKRAYVDAVLAAGALPIVLPYLVDDADVDAALRLVQAVVVTGGAFDVDPAEYGEAPHPKLGPVNQGRTSFERKLMTKALAAEMPVLGICGGMQLLNVIRGGTLIQDLASLRPEARNHEQPHDPREPGHSVQLESGSRLASICGPQIEVNTTHHQSVGLLGARLRVSGLAPDGIIEAIEDPEARFVIGVQWHPEMLRDRASEALMAALVTAARG